MSQFWGIELCLTDVPLVPDMPRFRPRAKQAVLNREKEVRLGLLQSIEEFQRALQAIRFLAHPNARLVHGDSRHAEIPTFLRLLTPHSFMMRAS